MESPPNTHTAPWHPRGTSWPCSHQEGSEVTGGPEAEVKGSWPGSSAGKGLLTEGPRTPTAELREAWQRLEAAFPCRVGARPKGSRAAVGPSSAGSRAQSAWLFRKTIADPTTRSLDSCSKSSSLEAARPGQAGSCPGGADRTAWRSGRDLEPVCRVPPSPARGRGGGGGGDRLGSSPHSAQRFAGAGPWPELWEPRFPGRAAAGPHLLAARDEAPGPTRTDGAGTGTGGRAGGCETRWP